MTVRRLHQSQSGILRGCLNYPKYSWFYKEKSVVLGVVWRSPYYPCTSPGAGPVEEEIGKKNFTFHIDVPISDDEIDRWVVSHFNFFTLEIESLNCNKEKFYSLNYLVEKDLLISYLQYKTKYFCSTKMMREI